MVSSARVKSSVARDFSFPVMDVEFGLGSLACRLTIQAPVSGVTQGGKQTEQIGHLGCADSATLRRGGASPREG